MKLITRIFMILAVLLLLRFPFALAAQEQAQPLGFTLEVTGYEDPSFLNDGNLDQYKASDKTGATITLTAEEGMGALYLIFDLEFGEYVITDETGATITAGLNRYLHEYVDLAKGFGYCPKSVTVEFTGKSVRLSEIRAFTDGTPPKGVQVWETPLEGKTDILLASTHGDDEQLFFAGLLPYYAGELGYNVQVVYLTDHRNLTYARTHEMLNGLWAVGVRNYPVFGSFADFLKNDLEDTYNYYSRLNMSKEKLLGFVVEQIRRFDPMVIVGHDFEGEYGHGMHMVYADLLSKAVTITNDPGAYPKSVEKYGLWEVPKLYIHLYKEDPIVLDYDQPLESFGGMTAFEVTRELGFPCHVSQQGTWFKKWIRYDYVTQMNRDPNGITDPVALGMTYITKASQLKNFSPCEFGLYRSTVGPDMLKNDFLENIITHDGRMGPGEIRQEQDRMEAERLEAERLEALRKEQERLDAERKEEEARLEAERLAAETLAQKQKIAAYIVLAYACVSILLIILLLIRCFRRRY